MARKSRKNLPQPEQTAVSVLLPELDEARMPAAIYGRLSVEDDRKRRKHGNADRACAGFISTAAAN